MKRTLNPIFPPAAIEQEYEKRLKAAIREMEKSCVDELSKTYKANEDKILDSATDNLLKTFRQLLRKWMDKFNALADVLPEWFVGKIRGYVARNLIQQTKPLRDAGLGFNLTFRYMSEAEKQVFQAIVAENVNLIKSIAQQTLTQVEGIVLRAIETGQDLYTLKEQLHHQFGVSERRAAMIARDQTAKATNNLARQRLMDYGITRGIWMHTAAGKTYRETHINDMDGVEYNIKFGCYDPDPKVERAIQPAELVNCHCVCRPVIPAYGTEERGRNDWEEQSQGKESEGGIIRRKYPVNGFTVNYDEINSKEYHDRFIGMTGKESVDRAMHRKAIDILRHRNGTEYEDIAMISKRSGKILVQNIEMNITGKVGISEKEEEFLTNKGEWFEIIHNHPGSSIPSTDDIEWLFKRPFAAASTIIGHNGSIYRLIKLNPYDNIRPVIDEAILMIKHQYPGADDHVIEQKASIAIIEMLEQQGFLQYRKWY